MPITKELCIVASTYTDASGTEKKRWQRIGHLHSGQDGKSDYITLDPLFNLAAIPRKQGDDRVFVSMFDPKPREGQQQSRPAASRPSSQKTAPDGFDDDIGF